MGTIRIYVAVVLFAFGDIALSNNASDAVTDNPRLSVMLEEDQSDRVSWKQKKMDSATIMARDESRRSEVRRMLASAQVRTAHDFYCAAVIFHHGQATDDYRLATSLAWECALTLVNQSD